MKLIYLNWFALLSTLLLSNSAHATNYYVSPTGNDGNSGTSQDHAWKTLDKVNSMGFDHFKEGDNLLFERGGTYYGSTGGELVKVSGFGAYGSGEKPILSGTQKITQTWTNEGNIWKVSITDPPENVKLLFRNDQSLPVGRYPDTEWLHYQTGIGETMIVDRSLQADNNYWDGGECVVRSSRWTIDISPIQYQRNDTIKFEENTTYGLGSGWGYFFQNHPNALNIEGEWCFFEGSIYLFSSDNPNAQIFEYAKYESGIEALRNNYTIENIQFFGYNKNGLKSNLSVIEVSNCEFNYISGNALDFEYGSDLVVSNNTISNIGNIGIGYENVVGSRISHNILRNIGNRAGSGKGGISAYTGIKQQWGTDHEITNNQCYNVGYNGISFLFTDSVKILNNLIDSACLITDDGGGIYTWSIPDTTGRDRGHIVSGNIINHVIGNDGGVPKAEVESVTAAYGIYIDDRKLGMRISDNIIMNSEFGLFIHHSQDIDLENNLFYNCNNTLLMHQYNGYPINECDVENNVFVNTNDYIGRNEHSTMILNATAEQFYIPANNTFDNNSYIHPFTYDNFIYTQDGTNYFEYDLGSWQNFETQDLNSKSEPLKWTTDLGVTKDEFIFLDYAYDKPKTIGLLGNYIDKDGNDVSGEKTIPAYGYFLAFKTSDGTIVEDLLIEGDSISCYTEDTSTFAVVAGQYDSYHWKLESGNNSELISNNETANVIWKNVANDTSYLTVYGCKSSSCKYFSGKFRVHHVTGPSPDFEIVEDGNTYYFVNNSENSDSYFWQFGDGAHSEESNPIHEYVKYDTSYVVSLQATNFGCSHYEYETVVRGSDPSAPLFIHETQFEVNEILSSLPNAFTPNADGENDVWNVDALFQIDPLAEIYIYSRDLHLIRKLSNYDALWDGNNSDGSICPVGNYLYVVVFSSHLPKQKGYLALIR